MNVHRHPVPNPIHQYGTEPHVRMHDTNEQELRRMLEGFGQLDDDDSDGQKSGAIQAFEGKVCPSYPYTYV